MRSAVNTSVETLQSGIPIARIEFLNELSMLATNKYFNMDYPVSPTLFLEFTGSERAVEEQAEAVGKDKRKRGEGEKGDFLESYSQRG